MTIFTLIYIFFSLLAFGVFLFSSKLIFLLFSIGFFALSMLGHRSDTDTDCR